MDCVLYFCLRLFFFRLFALRFLVYIYNHLLLDQRPAVDIKPYDVAELSSLSA